MNVSLRPVTARDVRACERWAKDIMAEQYQSRYWPQAFSGRDFSGDGVLWAWYLIIVDGEEVGTIWLEKENPNAKKVVLGIMLGREDKFGKGIGREAIRMALEQAQKQLGYQSVELHVRHTTWKVM